MSASNPTTVSARANIADLSEKDLPELSAFIAKESGKDGNETLAHLTWLLLENPARRQLLPLGCGARSSDGALVGCILYLPQWFVFHGNPLEVLGSSSFYVDESHRGSGGAIFLKFARAAHRSPLFGNSANAIAAQLWKARGAKPIPNSDHELLGVMHWPPVAEEAAVRRGASKSVSRAVGVASGLLDPARRLKLPTAKNNQLAPLSSVEQAAEIGRGGAPDVITGLRDPAFLRWRYNSRRDPSIALFAFNHPNAKMPVFVAVNERRRGHRGQIRSLNVLDIFPKSQPAMTLAIVATLRDRYCDRTDMIVLRGQDERCEQGLMAAGFHRRNFESPNGWLFDPRGTAPGEDWYFVPADGDWLI
jgi:hypothetical protein